MGYSFGGMVAVELVRMLEKDGHLGELILVDGAPEGMQIMTSQWIKEDGLTMELEIAVLMGLLLELQITPPPKVL